jgi:hypothetical protein
MADVTAPLIKALESVLKADTDVSAVVAGRVFTDVKQGTQFPYLTVRVTSEPFAADDFSGQTHTITLQSRSRKSSPAEAMAGRKAAVEALDRHEEKLTLDEGTVVMCQYSGFADTFIEDDGKTWQAVATLEVTTV